VTTAAILEEPRIVHSLGGRVRVYLPAWNTGAEGWVEHKVRSLPGVRKVNANRLTRNVLVHFDPCVTDQEGILNSLANIGTPPADAQHQAWKIPAVRPERRGELQRVRIPVPGLDSNPAVARELEDRLETLPGVRAQASALTGRMLVEWSNPDVTVPDLLAEISKVDLGLAQRERLTGHPLDRGPLVQGIARLSGATFGLGFLASRKMLGLSGPPVSSAIPLVISDFISVLRSFSLTRNGLRRLLGQEASDTIFNSAYNLSLALPVSIAAGVLVLAAGLMRGQPLRAQLAIGTSVAIAAIPEGLPLLTKISEAAVARRLSLKKALVRRLSVVEALGRVNVACADKTGTLTEGRLALRIVCSIEEEALLPGEVSNAVREVLLTAALASPPADGPNPVTHPTDMAVINGAREAGLNSGIEVEREMVVPFDPARGFHAALVQGRVCVKGAPEVLVEYCDKVRFNGGDIEFDQTTRYKLLHQSGELAKQGLRVLMVAEGPGDMSAEDPHGMVALGLLGITDPLRATVPAAVQRCREAGIRVIMITGDHPETARTVAQAAGLVDGAGGLISGDEIRQLEDTELDQRLQEATVVARATPLDKVRIVESLQRSGYTVAMTGDGANDAPAVRLADVGIAMGNGTEVAKQAADVVLADNDFSNIVEMLVEGRSFWQRIRRATGLLVGGNLGELGLIVGLSVLGQAAPLTTRQILGVNMISDVLPALAVGLQGPETRHLASLSREGPVPWKGRYLATSCGVACPLPSRPLEPTMQPWDLVRQWHARLGLPASLPLS
jgi:cation transport ATPase